jgi:hypothetical protein
MDYETEVEIALVQNNIKVVAIELSNPDEPDDRDRHLENLATKTTGFHYPLVSVAEYDAEILVEQIKIAVTDPTPPPSYDVVLVSS